MNGEVDKYIQNFVHQKVLVIGDSMLDVYVYGTSEQLMREAPAPVISIDSTVYSCGGGANTAVNVAALGGEVHFLSVIGNDLSGDILFRQLRQEGVILNSLIVEPGRKSISKKRIISASSIVARLDEGSVNDFSSDTNQLLLSQLRSLYSLVDAIIIADYGYGVVTDAVIAELVSLQEENPKIIVVDSKNLKRFSKLNPTAVKPNYSESLRLLGFQSVIHDRRVSQIVSSGETLLEETGAQFVHATLDEDGVVVLERNRKPYVISGCPHKNEQAIGAGDTYVAALTLGLAVGMSGQVAGEIAHAAAGFVLDRAGTATCSLDQLCLYFSENPKEVHDRDLLAQLIRVLKSTGKRIVFTNGCFDILHRGHVSYLQQAAALGDLLIVGVNTDESIRRLKGSERPINTLDDRMAVLAALNCVTYIVPFHEETPIDLIRIIQPDIYVKGADYTLERLPEARVVQELGGRVELIPFVHDRSTTQIIKKIKEFDSDSLASFAQLG